MRSFSLKDIVEYIIGAVIIIAALLFILIYYAMNLTESFSQQSYQIFVNTLLLNRLQYCLYEATGNPYYLFYAPNISVLYQYDNQISQCYTVLQGSFLDYVAESGNLTALIDLNSQVKQEVASTENSVTGPDSYLLVSQQEFQQFLLYSNITYFGEPLYIYYNINNVSASRYYFPQQLFDISTYRYISSEAYSEIDTSASPLISSMSDSIINNFLYSDIFPPKFSISYNSIPENTYNEIVSYLSQASNNESQIIYNITRYNNTFIDLYKTCSQYPYGLFIYPLNSYEVTSPNYDTGSMRIVKIYFLGLGAINYGIMGCNYTEDNPSTGQINASSCTIIIQ